MNIDRVLAGLPDDDDDPVPMIPRADNLVAMDDAFESAEYGIETESTAPTFSKRSDERPLRKRVAQLCKTKSELDVLDELMLASVGVKL